MREESKVKKRYDLDEEVKRRPKQEYEGLNPAELRRRLLKIQEKLIELATAASRRKIHALG
ncbi:MAG: hypothetical protein DRG31_02325 [Deltaproteobacteria bacterium]|nr:MAG: hypothetical protein DRG31_02325 [Deltaproteobacteria bacterium]